MKNKANSKIEKKDSTYLGFSKKDIPHILRISGEKNDPNFQDVHSRVMSKYLRERYWIKQWSPSKRWKNTTFVSFCRWNPLRLKNLGRKLDDPGDAFFELFLSADTFLFSRMVSVRTWVEVTEAVFPENAFKLDQFIRGYNGLREKGEYDKHEYIKSFIESSFPSPILQYKMADRVIELIKEKAQKGKKGGSYQPLISEHGTGVLIVGIPLWSAIPPSNPRDPRNVLNNFFVRLSIGLDEIKHSVLNTRWCPFDSIYVVWNPNLKSIDEWAKNVDSDSYSNPSNVSWNVPLPIPKMYSLLEKENLKDLLSHARIGIEIRKDRYSSLNVALKKHYRLFSLSRYPRPFGQKSSLKIIEKKRRPLKDWFSSFLLQEFIGLFLFIRVHGFRGLWKRIIVRLSLVHYFKDLYLKYKMKKIYRSVSYPEDIELHQSQTERV